jgi:hypothetical protein
VLSWTTSPGRTWPTTLPSASTANSPLVGSTFRVSRSAAFRNSARLKAECGEAGVTSRPSTMGETIGPPAEKL